MGQNRDLKKNGQMDETGTARCNTCFRFNQSTPTMPIQFHWGVIHLYVIKVCLFKLDLEFFCIMKIVLISCVRSFPPGGF
jgi:hypothetical protein